MRACSIAAVLLLGSATIGVGQTTQAEVPNPGDCGYFQTCGVLLFSHEIQGGVFGDYTEPHGCTLAGDSHTSCRSASAEDLEKAQELNEILLDEAGVERLASLASDFGANLVVVENAMLVYGLACEEGRVIARLPLTADEVNTIQNGPTALLAGR